MRSVTTGESGRKVEESLRHGVEAGAHWPSYRTAAYHGLQKEFDLLVKGGADEVARREFIVRIFTEKNRLIRDLDFRALNPRTIEKDYLIPRKDLFSFVLANWTKSLFLPELGEGLAGRMFMFGLGRVFSAYNDVGVQCNTDADLNVIVEDSLRPAELALIERKLAALARSMKEQFDIQLEINPEFTLMREGQVVGNLSHEDSGRRLKSALFYKSNEHSIYVIQDHERIRRSVFSRVRSLPDRLLFEHFLGMNSTKPSFMKIRTNVEALPIILDGSGERVLTREVIGSIVFANFCRTTFPRVQFISPPAWVFSMKYFVNRVYDYVAAMRNAGHSLEDLGFEGAEGEAEYAVLRNAHRLMLYFQELLLLSMGSYGSEQDYSYVSRERLLAIMELDGEKFRADFEEMLIKGNLLQPSNREKYLRLKAKILEKARDRVIAGSTTMLRHFPRGFQLELIESDATGFKASVPYTWADLGFFVFSVIASRMAQIVEGRLSPALDNLETETLTA